MSSTTRLQRGWLDSLKNRMDWLYYLEEVGGSINKGTRLILSCSSRSASSINSGSTNKSEIWLHCFHFGHPPFQVLKTMFSLLFKNDAVESFHCDIYKIAKHHRVSLPLSNTKSFQPFFLVHTDIWRPFKISNFTGAKWFVSLLIITLELHGYI